MEIECPKCNFMNDVEGEDLPERACDDKEFECYKCEHEFKIGWFSEVELR